MTAAVSTAGAHVREWRQRRRLSQLELALETEISARHLSFIETGRAVPSRDMLLRLAEQLDIPLRERDVLLLAGGYAPRFAGRSLDDPRLGPVREAIETLLRAHEPYPALAIDRHWNLITANRAVAGLLDGVAARLLEPPVNVLRLGLHPEGLGRRIENFAEWQEHLLFRLRRQLAETADPELGRLIGELSGYTAPGVNAGGRHDRDAIAVPLRLATRLGPLSLLSTTMMFGTPLDAALSETVIETFLPADAETAETLRRLMQP